MATPLLPVGCVHVFPVGVKMLVCVVLAAVVTQPSLLIHAVYISPFSAF